MGGRCVEDGVGDAWGIELDKMAQPQSGGVILRRRGDGDEADESEDE